jgi:hypothetical protein
MLIRDSRIINTNIVDYMEKQNIILFLDQIITKWINKNTTKWFSIKDLLDFHIGQHENWNCTPFQVLHDNYIKKGKNHEQALDLAGKAVGKLLKETVHKREEKFDTEKGYLRRYKLV